MLGYVYLTPPPADVSNPLAANSVAGVAAAAPVEVSAIPSSLPSSTPSSSTAASLPSPTPSSSTASASASSATTASVHPVLHRSASDGIEQPILSLDWMRRSFNTVISPFFPGPSKAPPAPLLVTPKPSESSVCVLHQYTPAYDLEAYLQVAEMPYSIVNSAYPSYESSGPLPQIQHGSFLAGGSQECLAYLQSYKRPPYETEVIFKNEALNLDLALWSSFVRDRLGDLALWCQYKASVALGASTCAIQSPFLLRYFVGSAEIQRMGRYLVSRSLDPLESADVISYIALEAYSMIVSRYQTRATRVSPYTPGPYFFGSEATTLDALVYGHLLTMRTAMYGSRWVGDFAMPELEPFFKAFTEDFYIEAQGGAGLKKDTRGVASVMDAAQLGVDQACREDIKDKLLKEMHEVELREEKRKEEDKKKKEEEAQENQPTASTAAASPLDNYVPSVRLMLPGPSPSPGNSSSSDATASDDVGYDALPFEVLQQRVPQTDANRIKSPTRFGFGLSPSRMENSRMRSTATVYSPFVEPLALFGILTVAVLLLTTSVKAGKP